MKYLQLCSFLILSLSCSTIKDYKAVLEEPTMGNTTSFIDNHPKSRHMEVVLNLKDSLIEDKAWQNAVDVDSYRAYKDFIASYPESSHHGEASKRMRIIKEMETFSNAIDCNCMDSLDYFLETYPASEFRDIVVHLKENLIDSMAWVSAMNQYTTEDFENYIDAFPNGRYIDSAQQEIFHITVVQPKWDSVTSIDNLQGYQSYLDQLPDSRFAGAAKLKIDSLDEVKWQWAYARNSKWRYNKYLDTFPNGIHAEDAEAMILRLDMADLISNLSEIGELPPLESPDGVDLSYMDINYYEIENSTPYKLMLYYQSKSDDFFAARYYIEPKKKLEITLPDGVYSVFAQVVNASDVRSYRGQENLTGGFWSREYYIETQSIPSYRRGW